MHLAKSATLTTFGIIIEDLFSILQQSENHSLLIKILSSTEFLVILHQRHNKMSPVIAGVDQVESARLVPHIQTVPAQTQAQREATPRDMQPLQPGMALNCEIVNLNGIV